MKIIERENDMQIIVNGKTIDMSNLPSYSSISINYDGIIIDGKKIPPCPTPMNNCTIIDNHVFIDGYEWKNSKWKKTLRALYHKYF